MSNLIINYFKQHYHIAQANVLKASSRDKQKAKKELEDLESIFKALRIQPPQLPSNNSQNKNSRLQELALEDETEQKPSEPKELEVPNFNVETLLYDSFLKPYENIKLSDGKTELNEAVIDLEAFGAIPIVLVLSSIASGIIAPIVIPAAILVFPWLTYRTFTEENYDSIDAAILAIISYPIQLALIAILASLILAGTALILAAFALALAIPAVALVTRSISTGLSLIASGVEQLFNNSTNPNKRDEENETLVNDLSETSLDSPRR